MKILPGCRIIVAVGLLGLAPPGTGKSPAERTMLAPVHALHRDLIEQSNRAREAAGDSDPAPPRLALFTSDVTIDKLSEILADNPRGILYAVDELDSWLGSHDAFTRDGGSRNRGEWMRLYDGGPHQVDRVTRGSFYVSNWGASILTATTPAAIARLARKLSADGLFQRFLVFTLQRMRERDDTLAHNRVAIARSEYAERVAVIFGHVATTVDPPIVRLAPGAAALYDGEHRRLLALTEAAEHVGDGFAAHVAKHPAMLARVALAFHAAGDDLSLPDGQCRHPCAVPLSEATMALAARFMRRAYQHAHAIYSTLFADGAQIALAQAVARSLLADGSETFNRRELTHRCRAFRGAPEWQRVAAFRALEDFAWIEGDSFLPEHGGRWRINPKVHTLFAAEAARWRERREQVRDALHGHDEA